MLNSCRSCCVRADNCYAIRVRTRWRAALVWCGRSIRTVSMMSPWSAPDPRWPCHCGLCGVGGLSVVVLDCRAFGGQAGGSTRIENYLGFPTGISGMALIGRAYAQAQKFGAEIAIPDEATRLVAHDAGAAGFTLNLQIGERVSARSP